MSKMSKLTKYKHNNKADFNEEKNMNLETCTVN